LQNLDFSKSNVKGIDKLSLSISLVPNMDAKALFWLRSLVKSKSIHSAVESLLLFMAGVGASPQSPSPLDVRMNAVEAGLQLSHQKDLVSVLTLIKTAPLKFEVEAKLPE
jgi:hypothetical protein